MKITADGPQLTVWLNDFMTVNTRDGRFAQGPFSLQYGGGVKGAVGGPHQVAQSAGARTVG